MKSRLPYAAAALSGVLLILIFPKFNYEALAWVALVPLLWAIRGQSSGKAALLGFIAGWIFFTGLLYWIYVVLTFYGHLPPPVSVSILLLMTAYLGLYVSAFAFLMRWIRLRSAVPEILLAPSLWVALEFIRGVLFSGFPWENLGYSQFLARSIVQMADVAGVHGVSFLIVLVNAAIYRLTVSLWQGRWRSALPDIAAAAALVLVVGVYGQARLARLDDEARRGKSLRVALIQGNIPQDVKWEPKFQAETMRIYGDLTLQAAPADLIIWPETATPFFFQEQRLFRNQILDLVGSRVEVQVPGDNGKQQKVVVDSPFVYTPNAAGVMNIYLPKLMDNLTTSDKPVIPGRININQAPKVVLAGIPGMTDEILEKILSERTPDPAQADPERRYETWLLAEGILTLEEMKAMQPFICGGGSVYRAQIVGYYEKDGPAARIEVVIDATVTPPKVVFWRDLSHLGRGYAVETLGMGSDW